MKILPKYKIKRVNYGKTLGSDEDFIQYLVYKRFFIFYRCFCGWFPPIKSEYFPTRGIWWPISADTNEEAQWRIDNQWYENNKYAKLKFFHSF